jgi:hypothetical protein
MPAVKEAATLLCVSTRRIHQMRDGRTAGLQRRTAATDAPRFGGSIPAAETVAGLQDADFGRLETIWVGTSANEKIVVWGLRPWLTPLGVPWMVQRGSSLLCSAPRGQKRPSSLATGGESRKRRADPPVTRGMARLLERNRRSLMRSVECG